VSDAIDQEIRILRAIFWSERDPEGRAFVPLADAYLRKGELDEARALLREGIDRHPDFATAHLVAARVHRARDDEAAAERSMDAVLALDPGNASALRMRGELAEARGELPAALSAFREAFRRNPSWEDLEGRIERLASVAGTAPEPERAEPSADQEPDPEEMAGDALALDDLPEPDDPPGTVADLAPTPEAPDGLETTHMAPVADEVEPDIELSDALELDVAGVDDGGAADERERAGDLDAHGAMLAAYGARGEETEEPAHPDPHTEDPDTKDRVTDDGVDLIDPFGSGDALAPAAPAEPPPVETDADDPVPPPEALAEDSGSDDPSEEVVTRTLGELYAGQGLTLKAVEVFEILAARDPQDEGVARRLETLRRQVDQEEAPGEPPEDPDIEETPMDGPGAEASPDDLEARLAARPIGDWFDDLLAWETGAVPIASLAPDAEPAAVPIASLAPDAEPAPVPIASLAPDVEPAPVPIASLAPDPEPPSEGHRLASPGETSADVAGASEGDPEAFEGLDDFQDWLRSLNR
jgi:tetratricopeptide (TPR) repeat protein